jgi:cell division septation protein DedD
MAKRNNSKPGPKESPFASTTPRQFGVTPAARSPETPRPEPLRSPASTVATAAAVMSKPAREPTQEEITARAKALWEASGRQPGRDKQNWLEAERQLRRERGLS